MISSLLKSMPKLSIIGHLDDINQTLSITRPVLQHVARYRQLKPWAPEAGGQMFGTINAAKVCVTEASGPYVGDDRARFRYRSNPVAAQFAIEDCNRRGLLYLGEWHTHAENYPSSSSQDDDAMRRLITSSQLNSSALLMMIVGRARGAAGVAIWNVTLDVTRQWSLSEDTESASSSGESVSSSSARRGRS